MNTLLKRTAVAAFAMLGLGGATGFAMVDDADDDSPLTGSSLRRASEAALASTGGEGRVVDSEHGDDGATFSVEVLLPGRGQIEVNLDRDYTVVSTERDNDDGGERDDDGPGDD